MATVLKCRCIPLSEMLSVSTYETIPFRVKCNDTNTS